MAKYKIIGSRLEVFRKGDRCPYRDPILSTCKMGVKSRDQEDAETEKKIKEVCAKFFGSCTSTRNLGPVFWYDIVKIMTKRVVRD